MLPAITPPTDNLYKFLSLFGLTIFLLAGYNLGIVLDRTTANSLKMEDIKVIALKKMYEKNSLGNEYLEADAKLYRFRANLMNEDLNRLENEVKAAKLSPIITLEIVGKIRKLNLEAQAQSTKIWYSGSVIGFGLIVMVFGFLRWWKREQNLRDDMLSMEHVQKKDQTILIKKNGETTVVSSNPN